MKKTMIFLLMLVMCPLIPVAFADDGEDGDVINVEYSDPGERINRGILDIPVEAILYARQSVISVQFTRNVGSVEIVLSNLSTGVSSNTVVDSSIGNCMIPVTDGTGFYSIEFLIAGGMAVIGYFSLQE